jgi:hypothetical protein
VTSFSNSSSTDEIGLASYPQCPGLIYRFGAVAQV